MDRQVTIRCNAADAAALEALQESLPVLSLAAIAREAMRIGLAAVGGEPSKLIRPRVEPAAGATAGTQGGA